MHRNSSIFTGSPTVIAEKMDDARIVKNVQSLAQQAKSLKQV
jgi:hypothetical protein